MSALTKWNPFRTSTDLDLWEPMPRWSPLREMERMRREMDRFFDRGLAPMTRGEEAMTLTEWSPSVDISEDDNEFTVKAELPEVKKEDVKVTVEGDVLTIRGERKTEKEEKGKKLHRIERSYGSFERSFTMPDGTDPEKIRSEFKDGMLIVHMPKNPEAKRKSVEIKVE
jgi:HSP20 family protein